MKGKQIYTIQIPPVSKEFAIAIDKAFPKLDIKPNSTEAEMKWNAAQREIVDYIYRHATGTTVTGNASDIKAEEGKASILNKILGK